MAEQKSSKWTRICKFVQRKPHEDFEELRFRLDKIIQSIPVKAPDLQQRQKYRSEHHKSDASKEILAVVSDLEDKLRKFREQDPETDTSSFSHESSTLAIDKRIQESHHGAEIERVKVELSNRTRAYESEKEQMGNGFVAEKNRLTAELSSTRQAFESQIELMRKNDETEKYRYIARMEGESSIKEAKMKDDFEYAMAELKTRLAKEVDEAEAALVKERENHAARERMIEQQFNTKKLRIENHFNQELADKKTEFEAHLSRLKKEFAVQDGRLRGEIESLNGALLARDRFTPITDHELESRFSDLAEEIDQLARPEWHSKQSDWTDHLLSRLSKNPKRLKKELLQDSLWTILYENIFCSPFRVFGEEGRNLEAQWNDAFGKGSRGVGEFYNWPTPRLDAERWRYETIKRCQEALEQPASEWDPRAKLKRDFKNSLDHTREKLSDALAKVSDLDNGTLQSLEDIPKKAAKMWIEMGTQRCRILVVMHGSNLTSQSDRVRKAREDVLELVIIPQLRRFGNSKGQDLYKKELIGGCDGSISSVRMS